MKLSDFLQGVGRPVAYYPGMARMLGDMKEAVFVCQMAYWKDKGEDPEGWIYKTAEEIEQETALSYKEQTGVRDGLKEKKLLEEYYARTEHKMYFRVDWDSVNEMWDKYAESEHLTKGKMLKHPPESKVASSQKSDGSLPNVSSLNSNTDTTQQTTHKAGRLSEKEIQQANSEVDAIIAASKKVKYENRDKIPEQYLSLCDAYVEITGQKPTKRVMIDWLSTFSDWIGEGLQPKDIRAAYQHATRPDGGFLVGRPGSLTNTAVALRSKAQTSAPQIDESAVANTLDMIDEKFSGTYAPPPDWVREHVKVIAQRASINKKGIRR